MATLKKGINGGFSGKAGSVIGSRWRGINYIKGLSNNRKQNKPPSAAQLIQREKFILLSRMFNSCSELLSLSFPSDRRNDKTGVHRAIERNMKSDRVFEIRNEKLVFKPEGVIWSRGARLLPQSYSIKEADGKRIDISWDERDHGIGDLSPLSRGATGPDDLVFVILYNEKINSLFGSFGVRHRSEGKLSLFAPAASRDIEYHAYLFLSDPQYCKFSETCFLGTVKLSHDN